MKRRKFLKISSLVSGGVVFGFDLNAMEVEESVFKPNLFIEISSENIITLKIITQELGQGIMTSFAMILAEELDADFDKIKTVFIPFSKELPNYQDIFGDGDTGGSNSIISHWNNLRKAGSEARDILIQAAAEHWKCSKSECYSDQSFVYRKGTSEKVSYGQLSSIANQLSVSTDARPKEFKDFKLIGKTQPDLKTKSLIDGSMKFGIDHYLPDMVYASIVMQPAIDSKLIAYEPTEIAHLLGILDHFEIESTPNDADFNGSKSGIAIIGTSTWAVFQAKKVIESNAKWESNEIGSKNLLDLKEDFTNALSGDLKVNQERGNVSEALQYEANLTQEANYKTPYLVHALMEPLNATVHVSENKVEIWAGTQSPQHTSYFVAKALNVPIEQVVFYPFPAGGGFGRRFCVDFVVQAALIAKKVGKPVKLTWTREDEIRHGRYQSIREEHYIGGLDKDNNLLAVGYKGITTFKYGAQSSFNYSCEHFKDEHAILPSLVFNGTWRSVGQYHSILGRECFIEEMAHLAKEDVLSFRNKLLNEELNYWNTSGVNDNYSTFRKKQIPRFLEMLDFLKQKVEWGKSLPENEGIGFAIGDYGYGAQSATDYNNSVCAMAAHIRVEEGFWEIVKITAVAYCGLAINPSGIKAQIEGSINWILTPLIYGGLDIKNGVPVQSNFDDFEVLRIDGSPDMDIHIMPSQNFPTGMGETAVPPATPAILNGIYAACGIRVRSLPVEELTYKYV